MRRTAAAALLLLAGACARCGGASAPAPERFLPAAAPAVLVVPALRAAQEQLGPLSRTLFGFPALADRSEQAQAVRAQLGFDPLDPKALAEVGLDPARGAGAGFGADGTALLLVLPVADEGRLRATVERLARDRAGAGVRGAAGDVTTFATAAGAPPTLALAVRQRTALLAGGPGAADRVATALALPERDALQASAAWRDALALLADRQAAVLFAPRGSPALRALAPARDGAALGVTASDRHLAFRLGLLLGPERASAWKEAFGASPTAGEAPAGRLPGGAFLALQTGLDPTVAGQRALWAAPALERALAAAGLDARRDLLDLLAPGAALSLALAPTFDVAAVSRGAQGLAASDPFRQVHLAAELRVKDPAAAAAALDRLARKAPALGFALARAGTAAERRWTLRTGAAAAEVALEGDRLLVSGGAPVSALGDGARYAPPTAAARAALAQEGAGAVLDLGALVASFRALPASSFGTGPDAFVMRSLAERVVDPASRLVAASARLGLAREGARVDLVVEAKPPAPEAAR